MRAGLNIAVGSTDKEGDNHTRERVNGQPACNSERQGRKRERERYGPPFLAILQKKFYIFNLFFCLDMV